MLKNSQVFEGDFYPQIKTSKKGKEALKEKTRALHTQEIKLPTEIKADKEFGPRYYTPSKIKDLQEEKEE
ncbi:hypothetical protein DRJ22_02385 [Candidatus Woesearchaeota archaeon]|nr:MAG: hypothetical protein DRJ22_02385 [Candidatus Woesearchaeota archaeon]